MVDWTSISDNPIAPEVKSAVATQLLSLRRRTTGSRDFLHDFVGGHRVLDIGIVEHDITHIDAPTWKHRQIQQWSSYVLGIDILAEPIALLRARGFNVQHVDATSETDLGERFDRVVMGDVIEHVNRPVDLLRFAARHLNPGGQILVSTPNPYWIAFIWKTLRTGTFVSNADHIAWISPSAALEIGRRAHLELQEYWLLQGDQAPVKRMSRRLVNRLFPYCELFASNFFYIFRQQTASA